MLNGILTLCLLIITCHRETRCGMRGGEGEVTHFVEGDNSDEDWEIVSDLYALCLVGDNSHILTQYLWIRDSIWEPNLGSIS